MAVTFVLQLLLSFLFFFLCFSIVLRNISSTKIRTRIPKSSQISGSSFDTYLRKSYNTTSFKLLSHSYHILWFWVIHFFIYYFFLFWMIQISIVFKLCFSFFSMCILMILIQYLLYNSASLYLVKVVKDLLIRLVFSNQSAKLFGHQIQSFFTLFKFFFVSYISPATIFEASPRI